ncbi:MAG TPA: hypothetical protein PKG52_12185 [bacterium]|nr:hypothetical protein [bacterium]
MSRKLIVFISVLALLVGGFYFYYGDRKPEIKTGFSGNLTGLVVGIPGSEPSGLAEVRDVLATNENKHAVRGFWNTTRNKFDAEFIWFDPDGEVSYKKTMNMSPDWTRTTIHYKGTAPLKAGKWTVAVKVDGKYLGKADFTVVRDESEIPLKAQIKAFNTEKLTINEAHFIAEKLKCYADSRCDKKSIISSITEDLAKRKVGIAVSIFRRGTLTDLALSSADNFSDSISDIINVIKPVENNPSFVELSILHSGIDVSSVEQVVSMKMKQGMGFSISNGNKSASILPTQIARRQIENALELLRQLSIDAGLDENAWKNSRLTAFMTQDFLFGEGMTETRELAFSRTIVPVESVTRDDMIKTVDLAFDWYLKNQLEDGRYMYTFFPSKDLEPDDDWGLRNLNAIFVLAEIAHDRSDPKKIESVKKAIGVFRSSLKTVNNIKYVDWKKHRPVSSIAATAFLLGAMVELYDPDYKDDMKMMADAIISLQEENGKLKTDFYMPLRDIDQMYYPGETLLALMRYYKFTKYEPALKAVEKAFPYYVSFWNNKENQDGPFVPWQIRAFQELYSVKKEKKYADFVFSLADWMMDHYKPLHKDAIPGRQGAFDTQFASTAVYSEGFSQALALAIEIKDDARIKKYGSVLKGNMGYLLGLQIRPEDAFWIKRPDKAVGALVLKTDVNELRLDATYHAISAINYTTKLFNSDQWNAIVW